MLFRAQVAAARLAARASRTVGAGGGTTLPGRLLLALEPDAIGRLGRDLPRGSVVISATNGKTTTARMLAGMISPPFRLSANRAGANLASGIASALLRDDGQADAGLFEVDEAALPRVAGQLDPAVLVLGNLFRDQLDRYGELETIAERWGALTAGLTPGKVLVRNGDDPLVASLDPGAARTLTFGLDDAAASLTGNRARLGLQMVRGLLASTGVRQRLSGPPGRLALPELRRASRRSWMSTPVTSRSKVSTRRASSS